jgi:hypothetical protein
MIICVPGTTEAAERLPILRDVIQGYYVSSWNA